MTTKTQTTTRKPAVRTNKRGAVLMTKPDPETEPAAIATVADVATQLAEVEGMTVRQLHTKFFEVFGEPTRSNSKPYLQRKISYRIQELAEGGLTARALGRIDELAETTPLRRRPEKHYPSPAGTDDGKAGEPTAEGATETAAPARHAKADGRDPRLPAVGETVTRTYKGAEHAVLMLDDGFEYAGERYRSLSAIAKRITGTSWNGLLFFGLTGRKQQEVAA